MIPGTNVQQQAELKADRKTTQQPRVAKPRLGVQVATLLSNEPQDGNTPAVGGLDPRNVSR